MPLMPAERAVTIAGPQRTVDLRVPAGVPVADLLPQVARTVGAPPGDGGWELVPIGGDALSLGATLADAAVRDGDVLHLRPRRLECPVPDARSVRDRMAAVPGRSGPDQLSGVDLVSALMAAAVVVPLAVIGWMFRSDPGPAATAVATVDGWDLRSPSVAFVVGALLLALLAGWVAVHQRRREPSAGGSPAPRAIVPTAAGFAGIVWSGIAGGTLVAVAMPAPPGRVVATGAVAAAFTATVVGGVWAIRRSRAPQGWSAVGCGGYGLVATVVTVGLVVPLGPDAAARMMTVAAPLTVGVLPALAVTTAGATRLDRVAAGAGITAALADDAAGRAAAILRGTLTGAVLVAVLAATSRWSQPAPVDLAVVGASSLLFALRARTLGRRFATIPILGAATMTVSAIVLAAAGAPVDRLVMTLAAVVVLLGAVRVVLDRRGPPSPAMAAYAGRAARWGERALVVLALPLATGVVDAVVSMGAGR